MTIKHLLGKRKFWIGRSLERTVETDGAGGYTEGTKRQKILEMKWTDYGKAKFEILSVSCSSI